MKNKVLAACLLVLIGAVSASTLSVSQVDYSSSSDFYEEGHFLIAFQTNGQGETLSFTMRSEDISNTVNGETDKNLEISADIQNVGAEYGVRDRGFRRIYNTKFVHNRGFETSQEAINWAETNCADPSDNNDPYYNTFKDLDWPSLSKDPLTQTIVECAVIDRNDPVYNVGALQSPPDTYFKAEWTIKASGKPKESAILSNLGATDGSVERLGPNTHVEFTGLSDTGSQAPNADNTLAAYSSQEGWKLISYTEYQQYLNYMRGDLPERVDSINSYAGAGENLENHLNNLNSESTEIYGEASVIFTDSSIHGANKPEVEGSQWSNGVFEFDPGSQIVWPEFLVRVDGAEYLEIEKAVGEPSIVSSESIEINEVDSETSRIEVTNIGEGRAQFEGRLTGCSTNFARDGVGIWKSVGSGERVSFNPRVSFTGNEDMTGSCEFIVEDRESGLIDSTIFNVEGRIAEECSSGERFVISENGQDIIYECAENNVDWVEIEECGYNQRVQASGTGFECVGLNAPDVKDLDKCESLLSPEVAVAILGSNLSYLDSICSMDEWQNNIYSILDMLVKLLAIVVVLLGAFIGWVLARRYSARLLEMIHTTNHEGLKSMFSLLLAALFAFSVKNWRLC